MQPMDRWKRDASRALVVVASVLWLSVSSATAATYTFTGELYSYGEAIFPDGSPLEKKTPIRGTFSFDPDTPDRSPNSDQGFYHVTSPHVVELQIGDSFTFRSDLHGDYQRYNITVLDNDDSARPTRDSFSFYATGSDAARALGLERVTVEFTMTDMEAEVFRDDSLPEKLVLDDFDSGFISFNFRRLEEGISMGNGFRFRILSLRLAGEDEPAAMDKPPIVDHFACSDYCPGPAEKYMVKVYQGVEDEEECRKLGGRPSSYVGWGTFKICIAE
jgi:hypothetical protein